MSPEGKTREQILEEVAELRRLLGVAEKQAALILQTAPLGIHECDAEGRITLVNPTEERIAGYTADELVGTYIWDRIEPGPQKDALPAYLKRLVHDQPPPTPFYAKNVRKNGEVFEVRVDWSYKRGPRGEVTGFISILSDVTEQRRAEESLRQSEERYRELAESTTDVIYIVDERGTLLYANRTAAAWFGRSPTELVGLGQHDLFPPEIADRHLERIRRMFATGEGGEMEALYRLGSQDVWLDIRSLPLRDAEGRVTSVMGVGRNITDRKRAEEALRRAHEELEQRVHARTAELAEANKDLAIFRRFAEASSQGFGMVDLEGRLTYVNPALCRLFGEERPEDVYGNPVSAYYREEHIARRQEEILPALARDGHWQGEEIIRSRGGTEVPILQSTFLIRDENGTPVRLASAIVDIRERRAAEEALRSSRDELQAIYDGIADGILITETATMRFLRVNPSACRMLGYSEEELLSMSVTDIHPSEDLPMIREAFRAGAEGRLAFVADLPFLRKDSRPFHAEISSSSILYDGRPCLIGFFRDITERRRAQAALERERRTLEHMLQASDHERQLIAYDIHDGLAQQIAGALMQFDTFQHLKETNAKDAASAYDAGMTMLRQSHAEARRLISGVRPPILDESGVVAAIAHLVNDEHRGPRPKIEFHSKVAFSRLAPVVENSIYRIVQEGLANASSHSRSETVRISLVQHEDRVRIQIQDWGIGFDPKAAGENRFGLEGIRERARLLGGRARIQSEPGKGTRIAVELPLVLKQ